MSKSQTFLDIWHRRILVAFCQHETAFLSYIRIAAADCLLFFLSVLHFNRLFALRLMALTLVVGVEIRDNSALKTIGFQLISHMGISIYLQVYSDCQWKQWQHLTRGNILQGSRDINMKTYRYNKYIQYMQNLVILIHNCLMKNLIPVKSSLIRPYTKFLETIDCLLQKK